MEGKKGRPSILKDGASMLIHLEKDEKAFLEMYSKKTFRSMTGTVRFAICKLKAAFEEVENKNA